MQSLPFFQLSDQIGLGFEIRHATIFRQADHVWRSHRLFVVNDNASVRGQRHAQGQRDAQQLRIPTSPGLNQRRDDYFLVGFQVSVRSGEAGFLSAISNDFLRHALNAVRT